MQTETPLSGGSGGPPGPLRVLPLATGPPLVTGELAPQFDDLLGVDGSRYSLHRFAGARLLILMFTGNACPAAKGCLERVMAFQRTYAPRGIQVVAINSNNPYLSPEDSLDGMKRMAVKNQLNFPYLKDSDGAVARQFGARNTPHFLVLDPERRLRYRGRMFDSREPDRATTRDLQDAVDSLLTDQPVVVPETNPLGCSIVW